MTKLYFRLAALAPVLLVLTAQAQTAMPAAEDKPAISAERVDKLALNSSAQLLQAQPTSAGPRTPAALTRIDVIRELQRARAAGELNMADRETTYVMH